MGLSFPIRLSMSNWTRNAAKWKQVLNSLELILHKRNNSVLGTKKTSVKGAMMFFSYLFICLSVSLPMIIINRARISGRFTIRFVQFQKVTTVIQKAEGKSKISLFSKWKSAILFSKKWFFPYWCVLCYKFEI